MKTNTDARVLGNEAEKNKMQEEINSHNCAEKLKIIREVSSMTTKDFADLIGVQESTISRLEANKSFPSSNFLHRLQALQITGIDKFSKMSKEEKNKLVEDIGAGVIASAAAVVAAGSIPGLSHLKNIGRSHKDYASHLKSVIHGCLPLEENKTMDNKKVKD